MTEQRASGPLAERASLVAVALASVALVTLLNLVPLDEREHDFWIHLKVAEIILETGSIPDTVLFSFSEARDFELIAHEWLASLGFNAVYTAFGVDGVVITRALLALLLFSLFAARSSAVSPSSFLASEIISSGAM